METFLIYFSSYKQHHGRKSQEKHSKKVKKQSLNPSYNKKLWKDKLKNNKRRYHHKNNNK